MRVFMCLGHKNLILLREMRSCNEHEKMPKWGIFNASVLLNEHGHPPFLFRNWSSNMINIQWAKFERKSIATFISGELP